jgi:uncharacterized protein
MDQDPKEIPLFDPLEPGANQAPVSEPVSVLPWGLWATIGWTLLIAFGYLLVQVGVVIGYSLLGFPQGTRGPVTTAKLAEDGFLAALATLLSAPVGVGLCIIFASLRRGVRIQDYLGWHWPRRRTVVLWCVVILGFGLATDLVTTLVLKRPLVPEVMVELYRNAGVPLLLWLAVIVAAPVVEEFIFRGFFFVGLQGAAPSPGRNLAAVLTTSVVWALIHLQYDAYGVGVIFFAGILLGYARIRTGSLWLCILMHALMNLIATLEVVIWMV